MTIVRTYEATPEMIDLANAINDVCQGQQPIIVISAMVMLMLRALPDFLSPEQFQRVINARFVDFAEKVIAVASEPETWPENQQ